jgi:hypothetical protein
MQRSSGELIERSQRRRPSSIDLVMTGRLPAST